MTYEDIITIIESAKLQDQGREWGSAVAQWEIYNQGIDQALADLEKARKQETI